MNSTVRSNLTVGHPIDLLIYEKDTLNFTQKLCLTEDDPFSKQLSDAWNKGLVSALEGLPRFYWENVPDAQVEQQANTQQRSS
jgi:putative proteasome-type protease